MASAPSTTAETEAPGILRKYFSSVIYDQPIDAEPEAILKIINDDFGIDSGQLHDRLREIIPYMFIYYMKQWPGWHKYPDYLKGILTYQEWFARLKQYLHLKLTNLVRTSFKQVFDQYQKDELSSKISEVSPVQISITGPPSLLNSIIFVNIGDDAVIKRHMGPRIQPILTKQIVNWPFVEVEFTSPDLAFVRKNVLYIERYLSATNEKIKFPDTPYIEKAEQLTPNSSRQVLTHDILSLYIRKYLAFIEASLPSYSMPKSIPEALDQFRMDVEELGMESTIATNTAIVFNIGKCKYVRSKKVKSSPNQEDPAIKYFEVITPKVEVLLKHFKAVPYRKGQNDIDFVLLSNDKAKHPNIVPMITFRCSFCCLSMDDVESVSKHFSEEHGMEQLLYCLRCHSKYEVPNLVMSRWIHECTGV